MCRRAALTAEIPAGAAKKPALTRIAVSTCARQLVILPLLSRIRLKDFGNPWSNQLADMIDSKTLVLTLARYREPDQPRALFELGVTALSLALLWFVMWLSLDVGYWLTLLLAVPAAGFLVRLFMIQHDCGHGAFFRARAV